MFGKLDPKKISSMMSKLGIKQEEIPALRVIIEKEDGKTIIENPNVQKVVMQGQESWQITGEAREEKEAFSEQDIKMVMEQTGKDRETVARKLEELNNDLARAIMELKEK